MDKEKRVSYTILLSGIILTVAGLSALLFLITRTDPTVINRWFFFLFFFMTCSGLSLLIAITINRFSRNEHSSGLILRHSLWAGILAAIVAWLRIADLLHLPIVFFLIITIMIIEYLLTRREEAERKSE